MLCAAAKSRPESAQPKCPSIASSLCGTNRGQPRREDRAEIALRAKPRRCAGAWLASFFMNTETKTDPAVIVAEGYYRLKAENETLRAKMEEMATELANCAGYIASVRTDRQITWHEELYALQTMEWAEGAVEIAEKANAVLEAHDAFLANTAISREGA